MGDAVTNESGAGAAVPLGPKPPLWREAAVAAFTFVVLIILLVSPWRSAFSFFYMGIVPGILALHASVRVAVVSSFATAAAVFVAVIVSDQVFLSVLWMTLLAVAVVYAARIGAAPIGAIVMAQAAIVAVSGHVFTMAPAPFNEPHTVAGALPVAGLVLAGGLVFAAGMAVFLHGYHKPLQPRLTVADSWWYGATIIPLTILGMWVCVAFFPGTHSWWVLLTIYVVLLPEKDKMVTRVWNRTLGTIIGAVFVLVVVQFITGWQIIAALALISALGTIATSGMSYTINAAFLTMTVLFAATPAANNPLLLHTERIVLTVLGALMALGLVLFNQKLRQWLQQRKENLPTGTVA